MPMVFDQYTHRKRGNVVLLISFGEHFALLQRIENRGKLNGCYSITREQFDRLYCKTETPETQK